ncbi:hypothetical protein HK102_003658, partial [Quaeritorhiza haematococci]
MRHLKARSFANACLPVRSRTEPSTLKSSQLNKVAPTTEAGASADAMVSSAKGDTDSTDVGKGLSKDAIDQSGTPTGVAAAGLNQEGTLPSSILTKEGASRSPGKTKKVSFDAPTMILNICHFGDPVDDISLPTLRTALGLPMADSTDEAADSGDAKHVGKQHGSARMGTQTPNIKVDVNMVTTSQQGLTPLHLACSYDHLKMAEVLLREAFSGVNLRDREGWTPLHCACAEGNLEMIKLLGRCQGRAGEERTPEQLKALDITVDDWKYPPDGPIDLIPFTADGETPEDVALEGKEDEIGKILADLKKQYPPAKKETSEEEPASDAEDAEASDEEDDDDDDSEDDEEPPPPRKQCAAKTQIMAGAGNLIITTTGKGIYCGICFKTDHIGSHGFPGNVYIENRRPAVATDTYARIEGSVCRSIFLRLLRGLKIKYVCVDWSKPSTSASATTTKSSTASETKAEDGTKLSSASHATSLEEKETTATTGASVTDNTASTVVPSKTQTSDSLSNAKPRSIRSESAVSATSKSEVEVKKVDADVGHEKSSVPTSDAAAIPTETLGSSSVALTNDGLCPPDGPLDVIPLNADGETPADVAFDGKENEIGKIFAASATACPTKPIATLVTDSQKASTSKTDAMPLPRTPSHPSKVNSAHPSSPDSSTDSTPTTSVLLGSKPSTPAPTTTTKSFTISETKAEDVTKLSCTSHATSIEGKEPTTITGASVTQKPATDAGASETQGSNSLSRPASVEASEAAVSATGKSATEVKTLAAEVAHEKSLLTSQHDASAIPTENSEFWVSSVNVNSKVNAASDVGEKISAATDSFISPARSGDVDTAATLSTKTKFELLSPITYDIHSKSTTPTTKKPSEAQPLKPVKSDETSRQDLQVPAESYKTVITISLSETGFIVASQSAASTTGKCVAEARNVATDVAHGKTSVPSMMNLPCRPRNQSHRPWVLRVSRKENPMYARKSFHPPMLSVRPRKTVRWTLHCRFPTKTKQEFPSPINHESTAKTTTPKTKPPAEPQPSKPIKSNETSKQDLHVAAGSNKTTTTSSSTRLPSKRDPSEKTVQSTVLTTALQITAPEGSLSSQSSESAQPSTALTTITTPSSKSSTSPRKGSADEFGGKFQDSGHNKLKPSANETPQQPEKQSQKPPYSSLSLPPPVSGTRRGSAEVLNVKSSSMATASPQPHSQSTETHSVLESVLPSTKPQRESTSEAADSARITLANDVNVSVATLLKTTVAGTLNETDVQSVSESELQQTPPPAPTTTTSTTAPTKFAAGRHEGFTAPAISTKRGIPSDVSKKEEPRQTSPRTSTDAKTSTAQHQITLLEHTSSNQKDSDAD